MRQRSETNTKGVACLGFFQAEGSGIRTDCRSFKERYWQLVDGMAEKYGWTRATIDDFTMAEVELLMAGARRNQEERDARNGG